MWGGESLRTVSPRTFRVGAPSLRWKSCRKIKHSGSYRGRDVGRAARARNEGGISRRLKVEFRVEVAMMYGAERDGRERVIPEKSLKVRKSKGLIWLGQGRVGVLSRRRNNQKLLYKKKGGGHTLNPRSQPPNKRGGGKGEGEVRKGYVNRNVPVSLVHRL